MHYHCICQSAHWMIKYDNLLCYMRALEFCLLRSAIVVLGHVVMPSFTQDSLFILCGRQPIRRVLHHVHHISFKRLVNNLTTIHYNTRILNCCCCRNVVVQQTIEVVFFSWCRIRLRLTDRWQLWTSNVAYESSKSRKEIHSLWTNWQQSYWCYQSRLDIIKCHHQSP